MDRVVERNASLVEDATQATESMNGQAEALLQLARRFHLEGTAKAQQPPAAADPAPRGAVPVPIRVQPAAILAGPLRDGPAVTGAEWSSF
jgi:methyl-accepting chemotaxis protein